MSDEEALLEMETKLSMFEARAYVAKMNPGQFLIVATSSDIPNYREHGCWENKLHRIVAYFSTVEKLGELVNRICTEAAING